MSTKSFVKILISLIITFACTAMCILTAYVCASGGSVFGLEFTSAEETTHINTMLLGLDKDCTRTDVMILGQLNIADGEINMLQIPRDTYVKNNGRNDRKINSAYGFGKEKAVFKEVKQITGIDVDKYVIVNTGSFKKLIDTIGGVDFEVPQDMNYDDPYQDLHIHLKAGWQHLDGDKAEQLVRFRSYPNGDLQRMQVQSAFIQATIDELFSLANVFKISDLVEDISEIIDTNFTMSELLNYAPYIFATDRGMITTHQLAGEAKYINGGSYVVPDYDANDKIRLEHFTPSNDENKKTNEHIEDDILLGADVSEKAGDVRAKKMLFGMFTSIDIIDASDGNADASHFARELKDCGFNVRSPKKATVVFKDTVVVAKRKSKAAAMTANAAGLEEYLVNPYMESDTDITVIIGKDLGN